MVLWSAIRQDRSKAEDVGVAEAAGQQKPIPVTLSSVPPHFGGRPGPTGLSETES